jgi:hypothetical protein
MSAAFGPDSVSREREKELMDHPAAHSIVEMVRRLNEMTRRARSGEPTIDDYLQALASDPVTEWFTVLLREKTEELEKERARADLLARAGRRWFSAMESEKTRSAEEVNLVNVLRDLGVIES